MKNRITSITMIGQWPHGIKTHLRNLQWALSDEDKIFIVTLPNFISTFKLKNTEQITFVPFEAENKGEFIPFWAKFPQLVKDFKIECDYFLFMEEDIWFHKKINQIRKSQKEIINYLPISKDYHTVTLNDKFFHARVWEGANLISSDIIKRAIENEIAFAFTKTFWCDKHKKKYEQKFGGKFGLNKFKLCDTMDDLSLYCALEEETKAVHRDNAVHIRGPESLHRTFPELYCSIGSEDVIQKARKRLNYIDIGAAFCAYYITGNWHTLQFDPVTCKTETKNAFKKIYNHSKEWMSKDEYNRLSTLVEKFDGRSKV